MQASAGVLQRLCWLISTAWHLTHVEVHMPGIWSHLPAAVLAKHFTDQLLCSHVVSLWKWNVNIELNVLLWFKPHFQGWITSSSEHQSDRNLNSSVCIWAWWECVFPHSMSMYVCMCICNNSYLMVVFLCFKVIKLQCSINRFSVF